MPKTEKYYKTVPLVLVCLICCIHLAAALGGAKAYATPRLPRSVPNTTMPVQSGATVTVASNCSNLQSKIDAARYGDTILIPAGTKCTGHYILRYKSSGSGWIIIRTAAGDSQLPAPGTRISPSYSNIMPKLLTPDSAAVITTEARADNYRLIGLEIAAAPTAARNPNRENYGLVVIGDASATSASDLPSNIVIDRDYIHCSRSQYCKRGVDMESSNTSVIDSYISEIHNPGQDTQAIASFNGPGPFKITNNFIEAAGENVMFGGADPRIVGVTARISNCSRSNHVVTCGATSTKGLHDKPSVIAALAPTDLNVGFVNYAAGDYRLSSSSPYKRAATDGSDIGANIDALNAATAGAITGVPGGSSRSATSPVPRRVSANAPTYTHPGNMGRAVRVRTRNN